MKFVAVLALMLLMSKCSSSGDIANTLPKPPVSTNDMNFWLTKGDQSVMLQKQNSILTFGTTSNSYATIEVDESKSFQTIDGFGYTLTGGSVQVINQLNAQKRQDLLKELFDTTENSIALSYLRISIGASDLDAMPFSYNDLPNGQTDINLEKFSLARNKNDVIPMLKEILAINPNIKIMATPWSPPVWM